MFQWGKKKEENQEIKTELKNILSELAEIQEKQEHQKNQQAENLKKILSKQSRQSLMLEELLEASENEMEERKEKEEQKEAEYRKEKEKLADALICAAEYLFQMERQADNAAWERQINLVRSQIKSQMQECEIQEIAEAGGKAEPSRHEVMEVVYTTEETKDKEIKEILMPGYLYKGKVKKKSKIIIYAKENESCQKRSELI